MIEIFKQDITIAIDALKNEKYELLTISGNRISSNALLLRKPQFHFIGFVLRDISNEQSRARENNEEEGKKGKDLSERFLRDIYKMMAEELPLTEIWEKYSEYQNATRKAQLGDFERSIYRDNKEFTKITRLFLLDYFKKNYSQTLNEDNRPILGITSELARAINCYGFEEKDLALYVVFNAFRHYSNYHTLEYSRASEEQKKMLEDRLGKVIQKILELYGGEETVGKEQESDFIKSTINLVGELGDGWRTGFLSFLEYRPIERVQEIEKPKIPSEAKKKIEDVIIEGLQKELVKK